MRAIDFLTKRLDWSIVTVLFELKTILCVFAVRLFELSDVAECWDADDDENDPEDEDPDDEEPDDKDWCIDDEFEHEEFDDASILFLMAD